MQNKDDQSRLDRFARKTAFYVVVFVLIVGFLLLSDWIIASIMGYLLSSVCVFIGAGLLIYLVIMAVTKSSRDNNSPQAKES